MVAVNIGVLILALYVFWVQTLPDMIEEAMENYRQALAASKHLSEMSAYGTPKLASTSEVTSPSTAGAELCRCATLSCLTSRKKHRNLRSWPQT